MTDTTPAIPSGAGSNLATTVAHFESKLAAEDTRALVEMTSTYRRVITRLGADLNAVEAMISARLAEGKTVPVSWLHKQARYKTLVLNARDEFFQYGQSLGDLLDPAQARVVKLAQSSAEAAMEASLPGVQSLVGSFHSLPENAIRQLRGSFQKGSPLRGLLDGFGQWGSSVIEDAITYGLATGQHPSQITKAITDQLNLAPHRAATIARTELYRSYREANRGTYAANDHIVDAWIWNAHLGRRTCAACLAMHGTEFPTSEPMGSHPNCRCTMLPKTKSWADLGFPGVPETRVSGSDVGDAEAWLRTQDPLTQRRAFGNNKLYREWRDGNIALRDAVRTVKTDDWGVTRTIAGTDAALVNASQRLAREREALRHTDELRRLSEVTTARVEPWIQEARDLLSAFGYRDEAHVREVGSILRTEIERKYSKTAQGKLRAAKKVYKQTGDELRPLADRVDQLRALYGDGASELAEYKRIAKQRNALLKTHTQAFNRIYQYRNDLKPGKMLRDVALDTLKKVRPKYGKGAADLAFDIVGQPEGRLAREVLKNAKNKLPAEWWDGWEQYTIRPGVEKRGFFRGILPDNTVEVVLSAFNRKGNFDGVALHELTHFAERTRPGLRKLENEFYERRTVGEIARRTDGYGKDEVFKKDEFLDIYVGKEYGGGGPLTSKEIATMGIENLLGNEPIFDILDDPDYLDFVLGVLAGV